MSVILFDENLFDEELFDVEFGFLSPSQFTVSGFAVQESPKQRNPFTFTLIGYINIRKLEYLSILAETTISRKLNGFLVASVEAIQRFRENMTIDSFILPDEAPAEMWGRVSSEIWETLLENKEKKS